MSAKTTGAQPNGNASSTHNRQHHDGSSGRAFTVEQKAAVIRIRRCKATAFYDILGLEATRTTASDSDIKKAYRKLSLLTHPDKNGYEGADEAFKMVSRAFQILSDPDKKANYDRFGGDPDSRFGSGGGGGGGSESASRYANFAQQSGYGGRGPMFEAEMSPEELFRQFFTGGMGGPFGGLGGFGGPGGFMFDLGGMGGPGIRVHQFGGNAPRRRPHNHETQNQGPRSFGEIMRSLLPILLLFLLPLLGNLFSDSTPSGPSINLSSAKPPHTFERVSQRLQMPYWVDPTDVKDYTKKNWNQLDEYAESLYLGQLNDNCDREVEERRRRVQDAKGWFLPDRQKLMQARNMDMPNCRRLNELTGQRLYY